MLKKILVPTDFSDYATHALRGAFRLAENTGAEVIILHVLEVVPTTFYAPSVFTTEHNLVEQELHQHMVERAHDELKRILAKMGEEKQKVAHRIVVEVGRAYPIIMEYEKEEQPDCIMIGGRGADALEGTLIGSTTDKVVRHASCPVFVIKSDFDPQRVRKMVFATGFDEESEVAVKELKYWQEVLKAELLLLRVNTPTDFMTSREIEQAYRRFIEHYDLHAGLHVYCDVSQDEGIVNFADDVQADLIVVPTHQRRGISHLFLGSIAEDVVEHAHRSVLTFNLKKRKGHH
ncbi:universal stress protein [Thermonema rossianum]|uniref:universal stress protein n=1 Tax=Thermonema rossianum TaxID=55505 RepID=UPI0005706113|nr:universal stress protein [Thermonema rossianum]